MEEPKNLNQEHPCGDLFRVTKNAIYNSTVFSRFFEENDPAVMGWAENVLAKLEGNGILPTFINKKDNPDFKAFWGTITHVFALIVLYSRKYKEIDSNRILFEQFIQDRGLVTSLVDSQDQMEYLFYNYLEEYAKRGRLDIINTEGELLGELLRLIRYSSVDEFIFALLRPEATGWSMGFSSPTWDGTDTVMNITKAFEYTKGINDLSKYPLVLPQNVALTQDINGDPEDIFNVMTFLGTQPVGIDGREDLSKLIIIDPNMSYEISLMVKVSSTDNQNLKFGVAGYETTDGEPMPMGVIDEGQITGSSLWFHTAEYITLPNDGIYYYLKGILLSNNEKFLSNPKLNFNTGQALSLMPAMKYIAPIFIQERNSRIQGNAYVYVYDFKVKPLHLPFEQGYLGERDIIATYYKNNAYQTQFSIEQYLKNYLIGYKNILGSELIRPYTGEESYRVLFKVFSSRSKYIQNATIVINNQTLKTDVNGEASIILPRGQWLYNATADKFNEIESTLQVTEDAIEYIQLEGSSYERVITFYVRDADTKEWLQNAKVTFDDKTKYTGSNGIITFDVFPGTYQYTVELNDYYTVKRTVEIIDSTNIIVELEAVPYYNVTFRVRNGVSPVGTAAIEVTGNGIEKQLGSTNAQGLATGFVLIAGTYHYKVTKSGYITTEADFTIYGNAVIDIQFQPIPKYNVNFVVRSNALPVAKAMVTFNGATLETDNNGRVSFVEIAGTYNWQVSKTEFYSQSGAITVVDKDITKEIDLVQIGYTVDFSIVDESNNPVLGAKVSIGTETITTPASGQAQFVRVSGSYNWTVSANGYYLEQGVVLVNGASKTVKVTLRLITYNVVFTVRINNQPVTNQPVILGTGASEETLNTDSKGNATFNKVPGTYPWTVSRSGYQIKTGTAVVSNQAIAIVIDLDKSKGMVRAVVENGSGLGMIENAMVTINGQSKYSAADGIAGPWELTIGIWSWSCSKAGYYSQTGNVEVLEKDTNAFLVSLVEIPPEPEPEYDVNFIARESGVLLSGVKISVSNGMNLITNANGLATMRTTAGSFTYTANYGTYYYPVTDSFSVYGDTTVPISFTRKTTTVTIAVKDYSTYRAISGAYVSFNGSSATTDSSGYATFYGVPLSSSSLRCEASKEPLYGASSDYFTVDYTDPTFTLYLGALKYNIHFTVKDNNGVNIQDATVQCNSVSQYTDYSGQTTFRSLVPNSYNWQAFKTGYSSDNGTATISSSDAYVNVTLTKQKCQLTYNVVNSAGNLISGVTVTDNTNSGITNSSGSVSWTVDTNKTYSWTASHTSYYSKEGSFTVGSTETQKTVRIVMDGDGALIEVSVNSGSTVTLAVMNTSSNGLNSLRVNWGDGTTTIGSKSHSYSSSGTKRILFDFNNTSATLQWSCSSTGNLEAYLTKVLAWFTSKVSTSWSAGAFKNCSDLNSVPSWLTNIMSGTAESFFEGCTSLSSVPQGLLTFSSVFKATFKNSGLLGGVNLGIVKGRGSVSSYESCFEGCSKITNVTGELNTALSSTLSRMFYGCKSLSTISQEINAYNVKDCSYMFAECNVLQSPCSVILYSSGQAQYFAYHSGITSVRTNTILADGADNLNLEYAFANCSNLSNLQNNAIVGCVSGRHYLSNTFENCSKLLNIDAIAQADLRNGFWNSTFRQSGVVSVPSNLIKPGAFGANYCFENCVNLTTVNANVTAPSESKFTSMVGMFKNCRSLSKLDRNAFPCQYERFVNGDRTSTKITGGIFTSCVNYTSAFEGCSRLDFPIQVPYVSNQSTSYWTIFMAYYTNNQLGGYIGFPATILRTSCFAGCTSSFNYNNNKTLFPDWF